MEKQQYTEVEDKVTEINLEENEAQTIVLKLDEKEEESIDLFQVLQNMGKTWKVFRYLMILGVCIGFLAAGAFTLIQGVLGEKSYASAVITFSFDGLDEGLDPNGGLFDVSKIKSTTVIADALKQLGWEEKNIEEIRANMELEGTIPAEVKQKIAVINTVSEDAAEYYTNIEDLDFFPSQYTVTLKKCKGVSGKETRELLDAILSSYRTYFMENYADVAALGTATAVLDVESYDYMQAADVLENEINVMQKYVDAKKEEAPDFRANSTGMSFGDLSRSIEMIKQVDLNYFSSFVQSNCLSKDAGTQIDYYNYQIQQYNLKIQELQSQLSDVEKTIREYEKDPIIVMSNQESVTETVQKNEYYDTLLAKKLQLNGEISELNTKINEAYSIVSALNESNYSENAEEYNYADTLQSGLIETVATWAELVQKTAEEYYEAELYANAYRISIPAQYNAAGGLGELVKLMMICGGMGGVLVTLLWGLSGLKSEIVRMRKGM